MLFPYLRAGHTLNRLASPLIWLAILLALFSMTSSPPVLAHGGGTPRLTDAPVGPYRLYVWTEPEPPRVGDVHLSISVAQGTTTDDGRTLLDNVRVELDLSQGVHNLRTPAEPFTALGMVSYEADVELWREGLWDVDVYVYGPEGDGETRFSIELLPRRRLSGRLVGALIGTGVAILLLLARGRRSRRAQLGELS